ncbi:uncharacterized protein LOC106660133 [Trichogramma pretiosum]|uniref:uncharacterized protein LOC106660133 n=1 Tax=Trichogramma pretiosum TaxID=7493 RepID=UPI0006C9A43A|nr:uncharacterized protein LOC106660133 [Trichogramma pretiosum]
MKCSVINCKGYKRFKFPKNSELRKKWLEAIKRPNYTPKTSHGLCEKHFKPSDMYTESYEGGYQMNQTRLKTNSIPSIFPWEVKDNQESNPATVKDEPQEVDERITESTFSAHFNSGCNSNQEQQSLFKNDIAIVSTQQLSLNEYEKICTKTSLKSDEKGSLTSDNDTSEETKSVIVQTHRVSRYNLEDYRYKPIPLQHFTGLTYEKITAVLHTLKPVMSHFEKLEKSINITIPNQLFLVLWKLRKCTCNLELAEHFNVSSVNASEIFKTWILNMSKTWSDMTTWPDRELVYFYMPYVFKNNYPKTRVTLDAKELKIDAPSNHKLKQATLSTYNKLNVKVETTPGDSIIDSQIIEQSNLQKKYESDDTILADKSTIQDLNAPCTVTDKTHRVHIEKVKKTFTILSKKLTRELLPLSSEIIQVCAMLSNFKDNII